MATYKCTNCNAYKRSRFEAGCRGSCGTDRCRECCESCNQHTLISMDVVNITRDLNIDQKNPILRLAARFVSEVEDPNHWRTEASITIDSRTLSTYWGPPTVITYRKGGNFTRYKIE